MLHVVLKKTGITLASPEAEAVFLKHAAGLSGADVEAILARARMKKALENQTGLDAEDLVAALEDFIPPSYPTEIELQTLAAVSSAPARACSPMNTAPWIAARLFGARIDLMLLARRE
jgi:SpoVK/Ycf46/Vps4 family AAA+-type ATPase